VFSANDVLLSHMITFLNDKVHCHVHYNACTACWCLPCFDRNTANTLACSVVATRIDYCNSLLYGISHKNLHRLQRVQNSLARVVCDVPLRSPSTPLLSTLNWLPVEQRISYKIATIAFKVRKHHLPQYLDQLIEDYATTRQLRSSYKNLLAVPYVKTDTAARAFCVSAPTIWNSLLTLVKSSSTLVTFKWHLETFLYRRAFDWPLILRASELSYWQITARYKFTDWLIDAVGWVRASAAAAVVIVVVIVFVVVVVVVIHYILISNSQNAVVYRIVSK